MNSTSTTVYDGCEADVYLNDTETGFLSRFPVGERTCFQSRSISTFTYGDTVTHSISRRCYLLSYGELFNAVPTDLEPEVGTVYSLLTHNETFNFSSACIATLDGSAKDWVLRSPYTNTMFYTVDSNGSAWHNSASSIDCVLRPALNVAPATIASNEGADKIYLITDSVIRTIDFKTKVLELNNRPAKALIKYNANNLSNVTVQVCNNFGDTNLVWVNATAMNEITFLNSEKETDK